MKWSLIILITGFLAMIVATMFPPYVAPHYMPTPQHFPMWDPKYPGISVIYWPRLGTEYAVILVATTLGFLKFTR